MVDELRGKLTTLLESPEIVSVRDLRTFMLHIVSSASLCSMAHRPRPASLVLAIAFALLGAILAAAAWLIFSSAFTWSRADVLATMGIGATIGAGTAAVFGPPLVDRWLAERGAMVIAISGVSEAASDREDSLLRGIGYRAVASGQSIRIVADIAYADAVARAEVMQEVSYSPYFFEAQPLLLRIRLANNSRRVVLLRQLLIESSSVTSHERHVLVVANNSRRARRVIVVDEGYGPPGPLTFRCAFYRITDPASPQPDELPHVLTVPSFAGSACIDLSDALREEGVDVDALQRLVPETYISSARGSSVELATGETLSNHDHRERIEQATGWLTYDKARVAGVVAHADQVVRFTGTVSLFGGTGYFPHGPSEAPGVDLRVTLGGSPDRTSLPIDRELRPSEATLLECRIGATECVECMLRAGVVYDHDRRNTAMSLPLKAELFVPRSMRKGEWWNWFYSAHSNQWTRTLRP